MENKELNENLYNALMNLKKAFIKSEECNFKLLKENNDLRKELYEEERKTSDVLDRILDLIYEYCEEKEGNNNE